MADSVTEETAVAISDKITMKKKDKSGRSRADRGNLAVEISKQSEFEEKVKSQGSEVRPRPTLFIVEHCRPEWV